MSFANLYIGLIESEKITHKHFFVCEKQCMKECGLTQMLEHENIEEKKIK